MSCALEPSAAISGDTFDYALDRETLHLSLTDPMGHDLHAALLNLRDGQTQFVNAGHPWPLRVRQGRDEEVTVAVDAPFGLLLPHSYHVQSLDLHPRETALALTTAVTPGHIQGRRRTDCRVAIASGLRPCLNPSRLVPGEVPAVRRA